jgi:hypothetical protein
VRESERELRNWNDLAARARGPRGAVVIYRGNPCCADLLACANAGHLDVVRGDLGASELLWIPDNGRDG